MELEIYYKLLKEYIDIVKLLNYKYSDFIVERKDTLFVEVDLLNFLLKQKDFLTVAEKKKMWRDLRWLDTDNDRKRFTIATRIDGKSVRKFAVKLTPFNILKTIDFGPKSGGI